MGEIWVPGGCEDDVCCMRNVNDVNERTMVCQRTDGGKLMIFRK